MAIVNLNSADLAALREVAGINAELAQAILAFRERSGPFSSVSDLDRVVPFQALSASHKDAIRAQVTTEPAVTQEISRRHRTPIDLNAATFEQLVGIRGLGDARADAILRYRDSRHGFRSVDEIDTIPEFADAPQDERDHIKGYLTL